MTVFIPWKIRSKWYHTRKLYWLRIVDANLQTKRSAWEEQTIVMLYSDRDVWVRESLHGFQFEYYLMNLKVKSPKCVWSHHQIVITLIQYTLSVISVSE